jgi:hypothetical protein
MQLLCYDRENSLWLIEKGMNLESLQNLHAQGLNQSLAGLTGDGIPGTLSRRPATA